MQQRSLQQVRASVSLIFLIHGLIIATWASRIPAFQAHLHLSPAVLGRSLMVAAIGSVLAMPAAGWLINKFGSLTIVIGSTLGFGLALPLIAESNTVLTLSVALFFYGAMAGSMDVAMNTHAVMLEKRYQRHIMSSFHALFSLGGMAGSALGGLVASRAVPAGIHFWVSGIALAAMSILAFRWLPLPSAPEDAEKAASGGTITWSAPLGALALLAFSIMLVEGAIADWSSDLSSHFGSHRARIGRSWICGVLRRYGWRSPDRRLSHWEAWTRPPRMLRGSFGHCRTYPRVVVVRQCRLGVAGIYVRWSRSGHDYSQYVCRCRKY
jgi:MFS family permease